VGEMLKDECGMLNGGELQDDAPFRIQHSSFSIKKSHAPRPARRVAYSHFQSQPFQGVPPTTASN
jgi:hypothetical protein